MCQVPKNVYSITDGGTICHIQNHQLCHLSAKPRIGAPRVVPHSVQTQCLKKLLCVSWSFFFLSPTQKSHAEATKRAMGCTRIRDSPPAMSKLPDIKRMTAHNLIVVLDITLLLISPQERETFPNLRGELPKTSPIQPNDATHTVERQRGWEIY